MIATPQRPQFKMRSAAASMSPPDRTPCTARHEETTCATFLFVNKPREWFTSSNAFCNAVLRTRRLIAALALLLGLGGQCDQNDGLFSIRVVFPGPPICFAPFSTVVLDQSGAVDACHDPDLFSHNFKLIIYLLKTFFFVLISNLLFPCDCLSCVAWRKTLLH